MKLHLWGDVFSWIWLSECIFFTRWHWPKLRTQGMPWATWLASVALSFVGGGVTFGQLLQWNLIAAIPDAIGTAIIVHYAWKNRPNKRKHIDKVLGKVKNLGHRLVVVPNA